MSSCVITIRTAFLSTALTVSKKGKRGKLGVNMRVSLSALVAAAWILSVGSIFAQDGASPALAPPRPSSPDLPSTATATVIRTNSMALLVDKKKLGSNDYVRFRVVED